MGRGLLPAEEPLEGIPARRLQAVPRSVQTVRKRTASIGLLAWIPARIVTKRTKDLRIDSLDVPCLENPTQVFPIF